MGQKVHPYGMRIGINKGWNSRWFADKKTFADYLVEDALIRKELTKKFKQASLEKIEIERKTGKVVINMFTSKPGVIIGRGGGDIDKLKAELSNKLGKEVHLNIIEVSNPDLSATLVAQSIATQLEKRISYRRAMKQAMLRTMRAGALGIKTNCAGRLGGVEIARSEHYHEGTIPLQTLRADIDYGFAEADTTYGKIGCKVWIYKGEILNERRNSKKAGETA